MITVCLREKRPFGVVLIRDGVAEGGPAADPYRIGCTAQITQVQPLDDSGRMIIITLGRERFRIQALQRDKPYLVAKAEHLPLQGGSVEQLISLVDQLHPLVSEYLEIMNRSDQFDMDVPNATPDPERFLYLAAAVIQLPLPQKQALLEMNSAKRLFQALYTWYSYELPVLRLMPANDQGIFSCN